MSYGKEEKICYTNLTIYSFLKAEKISSDYSEDIADILLLIAYRKLLHIACIVTDNSNSVISSDTVAAEENVSV